MRIIIQTKYRCVSVQNDVTICWMSSAHNSKEKLIQMDQLFFWVFFIPNYDHSLPDLSPSAPEQHSRSCNQNKTEDCEQARTGASGVGKSRTGLIRDFKCCTCRSIQAPRCDGTLWNGKCSCSSGDNITCRRYRFHLSETVCWYLIQGCRLH